MIKKCQWDFVLRPHKLEDGTLVIKQKADLKNVRAKGELYTSDEIEEGKSDFILRQPL